MASHFCPSLHLEFGLARFHLERALSRELGKYNSQGKNVKIDEIIKPFTTMTAYSQMHHNFNCVLGWKEAKRRG